MAKSKTETVKIKVPKRLERDIESYNGARSNKIKDTRKGSQKTLKIKQKPVGHPGLGVAFNNKLPKRSYDKIHGLKYEEDKMTVVGSALVDMVRTSDQFPTGITQVEDCYVNFRKFVHPTTILSRRLRNFSANYSKYKFKRFKLYFVGAKAATYSTIVTTAFTKDFNVVSPDPGISLKSYMSELHDERDCKVFDSGPMSAMDIAKDAKSFFLTLGVGDLESTFQGQFVVALTGADNDSYFGDLHVDYEVEFSNENVDPSNFTFRNTYDILAEGGTVTYHDNIIQWTCTDSDQVKFYSSLQGIYVCTLAEIKWDPFINTEMSTRNTWGSGFFLSIQAIYTAGIITSYSAVRFTVYPNYAAVIDGNPLDYTGTINKETLSVFMQRVSDTDPIASNSNPLDIENDNRGMPLGIGIGVGPGVLAGEPDISPSIGISHGRLVLPSPIKSVRR